MATEDQKTAVKEALNTNPEVKTFDVRTPSANYEQARELLGQTDTGKKQLATLGPSAFPESYFVTLKDPQEFDGVVSQVSGMDGSATSTPCASCSARCSRSSRRCGGPRSARRCC